MQRARLGVVLLGHDRGSSELITEAYAPGGLPELRRRLGERVYAYCGCSIECATGPDTYRDTDGDGDGSFNCGCGGFG